MPRVLAHRDAFVGSLIGAAAVLTLGAAAAYAFGRIGEFDPAGFSFKHELVLPASAGEVFDAATGDISGWWDHTVSESPLALYIEPRPGGGFYEIFDESGDGVLHATVTAARRGELLRFEGPLGLAGNALHMVHTYAFAAEGDSTRLVVAVHAAGEIQEGWAEAVEGVWNHFLFERLKPYVEGGGQPLGS
jgi:hypothetical protein